MLRTQRCAVGASHPVFSGQIAEIYWCFLHPLSCLFSVSGSRHLKYACAAVHAFSVLWGQISARTFNMYRNAYYLMHYVLLFKFLIQFVNNRNNLMLIYKCNPLFTDFILSWIDLILNLICFVVDNLQKAALFSRHHIGNVDSFFRKHKRCPLIYFRPFFPRKNHSQVWIAIPYISQITVAYNVSCGIL